MRDGTVGAIAEVLAEEVSFFSPALGEPTVGRDAVARVLSTAAGVYDGLRFTEQLGGDERAALFFEARVAGQALQGCYSVHGDGAGCVTRLDALIRPVPAAQLLVETMMVRLAAGHDVEGDTG